MENQSESPTEPKKVSRSKAKSAATNDLYVIAQQLAECIQAMYEARKAPERYQCLIRCNELIKELENLGTEPEQDKPQHEA